MARIILITIALLFSLLSNAQVDKNTELYKTLKAKDSVLFNNIFNNCNLEKAKPLVAENFEFYHDLGGIQNRKEFFEAVKNNICKSPGVFTRKLVEDSLQVFELKKNGEIYGAIQRGKHLFFKKENEKTAPTGVALFTHLWLLKNNKWQLKHVFSFNHLPYTALENN